MADWNIQRGTHEFGASENSEATSFPGSVVVANTIVRLTNLGFGSAGDTAGSTATHYVSDLSALPDHSTLTTSAITLKRDAAGDDEDVRCAYETWEGDFTVIGYYNFAFTGSETELRTTLTGFSDITQCVAIYVGGTNDGNAFNPARHSVRASIDVGTDELVATKDLTAGTPQPQFVVIEFDSNYTVQQIDHTLTAADTVQTETISSIEKTDTMVFATYQSDGPDVSDIGFSAFLSEGSGTTTTLNFWMPANNGTGGIVTAFLVTNSETIAVEHLNSINGSLSQIAESGSPQTTNRTDHTAVSDLATSAVIAMGGCNATDTNGGMGSPNYRFTSTSNIEYWRTESAAAVTNGGDLDIAIQAIQFTNPAVGGAAATILPYMMNYHG